MGRFVQYDYEKNRAYRNPAITITKNGAINFNAGMLQKYIKNKIFVILYFDKKDKRIGFEFLLEKSSKAFKIRLSSRNNFGTIAGRSFLNYYDISFTRTNKFPIEIDNETKYVAINLKKQEKDKKSNNKIIEKKENETSSG